MNPENELQKVAVILSKDVIEAREVFEKAVSIANENAANENSGIKYDSHVIFCEELTKNNETTAWTDHFFEESPVKLIEQVQRVHQPDIIICVFWKLFGSKSLRTNSRDQIELMIGQVTDESKKYFEEGSKQNLPAIKIIFSDKEKSSGALDEVNRLFVQHFRAALYEKHQKLWYSCKKNSAIQKVAVDVLTEHLNKRSGKIPAVEILEPLFLELPEGWLYLNKYFKENYESLTRPLEKEFLQDFFDGRSPSFEIAFSDAVPRRIAVGELLKQVLNAAEDKKHQVVLLKGPDGEGKSTILLQMAGDLVRQNKLPVHVIYRKNKNAPLPEYLIDYLLTFQSGQKYSNHTFVVVSDDAHTLAGRVLEYAQAMHLNQSAPNKIQFLMASQGTEWQWKKIPSDSIWRRVFGGSNFIVRDVKRLARADAENIVRAWQNADSLGRLEEIENNEERWEYFYNSATDAATKDENSNSFYGAMLDIRKSQTLEGYVEEVVERLKERRSLNGRSLKYYFAYVIALHADGFPLLRRRILQQALKCTEEELIEEILNPLKDEKVTWGIDDEFIFARHDVVAAVAKRFYEKESSAYFYKIIGELAAAAEHCHARKSPPVAEIGEWRKMPKIYFEELNRRKLALSVAEAVARELQTDPVAINLWANLLRKNDQNEEAAKVFIDLYKKETSDKGYFTEWGVSLGKTGYPNLSCWLLSIALSDYVEEREDRTEPVLMRLSSIASSFGKLFQKYSNRQNAKFYSAKYSEVFKKAVEAAVRFGLHQKSRSNARSKYDFDKSLTNLEDELAMIGKPDIASLTLEKSFEYLVAGMTLAWELRNDDKEKLLDYLPSPSQLTFNEFRAIFEIKKNLTEKYVFRKTESGFWQLGFESQTKQFPHRKGFLYIQKLLRNANAPVRLQTLHQEITGSTTDKSQTWRNNFDNRFSDALEKIKERLPELETHLKETIELQTNSGELFVIYQPKTELPWKFH